MEGAIANQSIVDMDMKDAKRSELPEEVPQDEIITPEKPESAPEKPSTPPREPSPILGEPSPTPEKSNPAPEVKKTKPTLKVRENLMYWKCNQALHDGGVCGSYNEVNFRQCKDCKSRRGVGDDGTDAYGTKIAKIVLVNNTNGNELWQYVTEE
ncbi:hypothetical protein FGRMN_6298 [Fusarium graminum]|nr:hypothetical protein FGRMN_6298 [Fusarium graminum]